MKNIVLITTGQPATNPRLVKEADSLAAAGFAVTVLYCFFIQWATDVEKTFLGTAPWNHQLVGGSPEKSQLLYNLTRVRFKLARLLNSVTSASVLAEKAQARAFDELLSAAKKIKADLYVGHNLGALPIAVLAAKHNGAKAGFDFEDYHRGEYRIHDKEREKVVWLETKYVNALSYYSCSSPLIADAVKRDHPGFKGNRITLLNCFPIEQQPLFRQAAGNPSSLKLFWFSQTIGKDRGLETVMEALGLLNDSSIELTLAGRCNPDMKEFIRIKAMATASPVHFAGIIPPDELPQFASQFDVGIATEKDEPQNRDLCLTNKIFTYLLAGNAILASDTRAQAAFFHEVKNVGLIYKQNSPSLLAEQIKTYKNNRALLLQHRSNAYASARTFFNWERESQTLLEQYRIMQLS